MIAKRNHIKIFVASTIYNFEYQLDKIYELLDNYGYDVYMSHKGTVLLNSDESNKQNCLNGVKEADIFIGFIRPSYGSGVLKKGDKSITHYEFEEAIKINIPRFILADYRVVFARSFFKDAFLIEESSSKRISFNEISFENNKVMDVNCIKLYNLAIIDNEKDASKRIGNWVQEYIDFENIKMHLESQFKYPERIKNLIAKYNKNG